MSQTSVLLVGSGPMAVEYAKVFKALNLNPVTVGRGPTSAEKFTAQTGFAAATGGIDAWLADTTNHLPDYAVVAVGEKWIGTTALALLSRGVRHLLLEKPGGHTATDIRAVAKKAAEGKSTVNVGYNRRFYASVEAAKKIIEQDGGVTSFNFEFTEWGHVVSGIEKEAGVKEEWLLANSTHVMDLAFHLGGRPKELSAFTSGGVAWHPTASVFAGAGIATNGALFSYQANWEAPGRWSVEMLTRKHRLIFRPMEKLQIQKIGSVAIEGAEIDDALDTQYKPGLFKQVEAFMAGRTDVRLPTIANQVEMLEWYLRIRGDRK